MNYVACFDIGGTFIKYALIDETGKMHEKGKAETPRKNSRDLIIALIEQKVSTFQRDYPVSAIGISSCGIINSEAGEVLLSANIPEYTGLNLRDALYERTALPVAVENDVKCALLGERWLGAAKGKSNVTLLTLGTGIGGGIIIGNEVVKGVRGLAGELGHMIIVKDGLTCGCGSKGCYEKYASTSALIEQYMDEAQNIGLDVSKLTGEIILERVQEGEVLARKVYDTYVEYIATGLVSIAHLLNPEVILIGGGISAQGDWLINDIREAFKRGAMPIYHSTSIQYTQLGNNAALYGSYTLVS